MSDKIIAPIIFHLRSLRKVAMLKKVNASVKLYLLMSITAASLIGLGLYCINDLKKMDDNTHSLYVDRVLPFQQLVGIRFQYGIEILPIAQLVKNHELSFDQAKVRLQKAQTIINTNWHNYKLSYLTPEEAQLVKQTDILKKQADKRSKELEAILTKRDTKALDELAPKKLYDITEPFYVKLTQLMDMQVRVGKQLFQNNSQIYRSTSKKFFVVILIALSIALSISFFLIRSIRNLIGSIIKNSIAIKESEEKYHSLFEQASDAIYVFNYKGDFTQVNDSMCNLVGYTRDELLTMNINDLVNAETLDKQSLVYSSLKSGESAAGERKAIKKDGTIFDVEVNVKKFSDDRILVIARDITERKKMAVELRKAELKFRTLADKSKVGIYILQKGTHVYLNPRFAEVFGYEVDELMRMNNLVNTVIHPDYHATVFENVRTRVEGDTEHLYYEVMGMKKDGCFNWVEFYGSRVMMEGEVTIVGSMIDITDRKMAEEALRASAQKYKLLFESNPVPLWIVAKDDLTVTHANDAAAKLYGYPKGELLNMDIRKLRPEIQREQLVNNYQTGIAEATDFGIIEHVKSDGTPILVNVISQDILFDGRRVVISSTNDVTEKIKAEQKLKATEANLQTILSNTDTAYALFNADLDLLEYNSQALTFAQKEFNYDPNSNRKIYELMADEARVRFLGHIDEVFKGNTINYEVCYPQQDDTTLWYYIRMFPISNTKNETLGLVLAISDITERKIAEQSLLTAYDKIKIKIQYIREMAWKQSHILRSPVANIKGLVDILGTDPGDTVIMGHIQTELERMDAVFNEMAADSAKEEMNY